MKYYLIAGERSGDNHAARLMHAIKEKDVNAEFRFIGGDAMQEQGGEMLRHYKDMSFMGIFEVVSRLPAILGFIKECKKDISSYNPDVVICVDFAAFNMRIAKYAKLNGFKVFYYISPKIWAWNTGRAKKIKAYVDRMFCILPFEKDFYKQYDYDVDYVGNPTMESVRNFKPSEDFLERNNLQDKPILAILPGSRSQEIEAMLHFMISIIPSFQNYHIVVAAVPNLSQEYYEMFRRKGSIKIIYDETYNILSHAKMAVVTSGTATLETAIFNVPQVVCYKTSWLTATFGRAVLQVDYISLVNLIMGKEVVKELIQKDFTPNQIIAELRKIDQDKSYRNRILSDYEKLRELLGKKETAVNTAALMIKYLD